MNKYLNHLQEVFNEKIEGIDETYGQIFINNKESIRVFEEFEGLKNINCFDQFSIMQLVWLCQELNDIKSIEQIKSLFAEGIEKDDFTRLANRSIGYLKGLYERNIDLLKSSEQNQDVLGTIERYKKGLNMMENYFKKEIQKKINNQEKIELDDLPNPGFAILPNFVLVIFAANVNINDIMNYIKLKESNQDKNDKEIVDEIIKLSEEEKLKNLQEADKLTQSL